MSDSDNHTILFVGKNLVFLGRVENLAEPLGYDVRRATSEAAFWDSFGTSPPALILVDLEGDEAVWGKVLEGIHRQESAKSRVVAFALRGCGARAPTSSSRFLSGRHEPRCALFGHPARSWRRLDGACKVGAIHRSHALTR